MRRIVLAFAVAVAAGGPLGLAGQEREPQVPIVQTVGCVEVREGPSSTWWLQRAIEPEESRAGVFNETDVEEASSSAAGSRSFQLVGVADFLDAESLLAFGDRASFTTADQVNATGELRAGRRVLVKGLLIEDDGVSRINLLAVVGLSDGCR